MAYTSPFRSAAPEGQTTIQLCPRFLAKFGQTPFLDSDGKPQNKKMHDSVEILAQNSGTKVHINKFAGLELTLFHEV